MTTLDCHPFHHHTLTHGTKVDRDSVQHTLKDLIPVIWLMGYQLEHKLGAVIQLGLETGSEGCERHSATTSSLFHEVMLIYRAILGGMQAAVNATIRFGLVNSESLPKIPFVHLFGLSIDTLDL